MSEPALYPEEWVASLDAVHTRPVATGLWAAVLAAAGVALLPDSVRGSKH